MSVVQRIRNVPSWQVTLGVALLGLGFIIAAQLRSQAPAAQYSSNERTPLISTALGLQSQQNDLKAQILDLRAKIQAAENGSQGNQALVKQLNQQLQDAQIAAGLVALKGQGMIIQLQDSTDPVPAGGNQADYLVSARDLRTVVDQLWLSGAEAISVNGERVVTTSAILDIGGSILVNSAYLTAPYQITAIGPSNLADKLFASAGFQDFSRNRVNAVNLRVTWTSATVTVPAYAGTVQLRYSRPGGASPSAGP